MEQDYGGIVIALMVIGEQMICPNLNDSLADNWAPWMGQELAGAQESERNRWHTRWWRHVCLSMQLPSLLLTCWGIGHRINVTILVCHQLYIYTNQCIDLQMIQ